MTFEQLAACTGCRNLSLASRWLEAIVQAMVLYRIDTQTQRAMFLANIGHESGGLVYAAELWGPTDQQQRYEPPSDLARSLGNTLQGDGKRFRGHGLIQITGRANHARVRDRLREHFPEMDVPDFELDPEALAERTWAALSAADFWDDHDLNSWADMGSFDGVCDIINKGHKTRPEGDANGYAERVKLYAAALKALA